MCNEPKLVLNQANSNFFVKMDESQVLEIQRTSFKTRPKVPSKYIYIYIYIYRIKSSF